MRMLLVAWREFTSVVFTKGFLIGVLVPPIMMVIAGGAVFLMKNLEAPRVKGRFAVVDSTGVVGPLVAKRVPDDLASRSKEGKEKAAKAVEDATKKYSLPADQLDPAKAMAQSNIEMMFPKADIRVELLPPETDLEALKNTLRDTKIKARAEETTEPLLAVASVGALALTPGEDGKFGVFDLFVAPKLDIEIQGTLERSVGESIIDARIAGDPRVASAGLDAKQLRAMLARPNIDPITMTKSGERKSIGELQMLIPVGFMVLMMISVMTTGQYLLTTVVEEKSSRVMEVLLSAVSPMQLMTGKILGHMSVGVLIVGIYGSAGVAGLIVFALRELVTPMMLVYLICYFVIAAVSMAAMMAAIGAAVNEMREAQTLMTPVIMITILPWMMWFFIQRAPNSSLATSLSFVPVVGPFVMVLRLGGSEPVPTWQHPVAILIGIATCAVVLWAAAKIFRIGVLMYGKPPNFSTLIRWVRMA